MNECVNASVRVMQWWTIAHLVHFPYQTQLSWNRLQVHCNPDQEKAVTDGE